MNRKGAATASCQHAYIRRAGEPGNQAEEARGMRSGRVNEEDDGVGDVDMDEGGAR